MFHNRYYDGSAVQRLQTLPAKVAPVHLQMMGRGQLKTVCGETSMNHLFAIDGFSVRQDNSGRYYLNDLHRAAGGGRRHKLTLWLNLRQTNELVQLLSDTGIPVSVIQSQSHFFELKFSEHFRLLDTVH